MTDLKVDTIGGFPLVSDSCQGCGERLLVENAWMTDGCPCNTALGVNSLNETRWRLLMQLQQEQSREVERLRAVVDGAVAEAAKGELIGHIEMDIEKGATRFIPTPSERAP